MDTVTLCACAKNEGPYLMEWIAFHRVLGFDRIVIYDNDSTDGSKKLLKRLHRANIIERRRHRSKPTERPQLVMYADALRRCDTDWIGFLDIDEFLFLYNHSTIKSFLATLPPTASQVCINWRIFGSSNKLHSSNFPVTLRFRRASLPEFPTNRHVKSFARVKQAQEAYAHSFKIKSGCSVSPDGTEQRLQNLAQTLVASHKVASIHHYVLKSREEFRIKAARGSVNLPPLHARQATRYNDNFWNHHDRNEIAVNTALKKLPMMALEWLKIKLLLNNLL